MEPAGIKCREAFGQLVLVEYRMGHTDGGKQDGGLHPGEIRRLKEDHGALDKPC